MFMGYLYMRLKRDSNFPELTTEMIFAVLINIFYKAYISTHVRMFSLLITEQIILNYP